MILEWHNQYIIIEFPLENVWEGILFNDKIDFNGRVRGGTLLTIHLTRLLTIQAFFDLKSLFSCLMNFDIFSCTVSICLCH